MKIRIRRPYSDFPHMFEAVVDVVAPNAAPFNCTVLEMPLNSPSILIESTFYDSDVAVSMQAVIKGPDFHPMFNLITEKMGKYGGAVSDYWQQRQYIEKKWINKIININKQTVVFQAGVGDVSI